MLFDFSKEEASYKALVAAGGNGVNAEHQQILTAVGKVHAKLLLLSSDEQAGFKTENAEFFSSWGWRYYQGWREQCAKSYAHLLDVYKLLNVKLYVQNFRGETFYAGIPEVTAEEINAAIDEYAEPEVRFGDGGKVNGCSGVWLEKVGIDGKLHPCDERGNFKELTDFNDIYSDGTMITKAELDEY